MMISDQKIMEIATKLLEKSTEDRVVWKEVSDMDYGDYYCVQFPHSRFNISYVSPSTEPDKINIWIDNKKTARIADVDIYENPEDPKWKLALSLYVEADRFVKGWDKTLNEIEKELQKEGSIGQ